MRQASFIALFVLSFGVVGYAIVAYALFPLGAAVDPAMRPSFASHAPAAIYTHIFASAVALALGALQFIARLRDARPAVHRGLGRLYLGAGVLPGGVAGLLVAFGAYGGPVARWGFASLAIGWLWSGAQAYRAIRSGDVVAHRRWMYRNFALTFAAVTLRLWLPGLVLSGVPMAVAYPIIGWLCWVPNLIAAEILFNRREPA